MQIDEPQVTSQLAVQLGLTEDEFEMIKGQLGRTPNLIELQIYTLMWSERSSFKNALHWLKTLPLESPHILPGKEVQDLKLIDIGDGMVASMHFHSLMPPNIDKNGHVSPFSSPAVTYFPFAQLGLTPLATLNSLRTGSLEKENSKKLFVSAVQQLSHYHNAFGIPTIGGEVYFDPGYQDHPIFDLFSFALGKAEDVHSPDTNWNELPIFLAGNIQNSTTLPDPISDRNLLHAVLEAIQAKQIHSLQSMPIGGLGRAAARLGWKTKTGINLNLDSLQSHGMQEDLPALLWSGCRQCLLLVGEKEQASEIKRIFQKWQVMCEPLGHLTNTDKMQVYLQNEKIADLSPSSLILESNTSSKENTYEKPAYIKKIRKYNPNRISKPSNYLDIAQKIWQSPSIISRRWIYEQFDSRLGNNTLSSLSSDAALLRIKGSRRAIALSVDCNPYYVFSDPYIGAMIAVCEAARNITCSGGDIKAMQYGLHFGDPARGDDYWQFVNAVKGIGDACRKFEIPVTGGDLRFHQSQEQRSTSEAFLPTPVVGMMGIIDDVDNLMSPEFKEAGDQIYMLGTPYNDFASSEYLRVIHEVHESPAPKFELDEEYHNLYNLKVVIRKKLIQSAHDISEGGLITALLEAALPRDLGFDIETDGNFRKDAYLFGESQGRIIVTVTLDNEDELVNYLNSHNVSFSKLGEVVGRRVMIDNQDFGLLKDWKSAHEQVLAEKLDK